jgi:hypothetical protein
MCVLHCVVWATVGRSRVNQDRVTFALARQLCLRQNVQDKVRPATHKCFGAYLGELDFVERLVRRANWLDVYRAVDRRCLPGGRPEPSRSLELGH